MLKRGIVRKTFLFASLLIVLVTVLSFSVLYFAMPSFYLYKKGNDLQSNLNSLTQELKTAKSQEECVSLMSAFVDINNVSIISFAEGDTLIPELSSPFVSMQNRESKNIYYVTAFEQKDSEDNPVVAIKIRQEMIGNTSGGIAMGISAPNGAFIKKGVDIQEAVQINEGAYINEGDLDKGGRTTEIMQKTTGAWLMRDSEDIISLRGAVNTKMIDYIIIGGTLQPIDEAKGVILELIPYVLIVGIAIGLIFAWVYARQISKPILQISGAALKMQKLEPDAISGIRSKDELGQLSQNLDALYLSLRENIDTLRGEMDKVGRLERSKTEMMQSASHELKTPIAALSGMLDGMIDNVGAYKNREKYLPECKKQIDRLSELVVEILNASRSDMMDGKAKQEETAVHELVSRIIEEYNPVMQENRLNVSMEISQTVITTDSSMLYRALSNLVQNAVRYTQPDGKIIIRLSEGIFCIENECFSISEEELSKLFEPFYTGSYSRDRSESGTGLGLYIVKRNLELLGIPFEAKNTDLGLSFILYFTSC